MDSASSVTHLEEGALSNPDLAPTPPEKRTWNRWHLASLWVGMSVCIPTYMLAASMIDAGMTWWESLLTILLGNALVLIPLAINGHAGTRYGIPFPIYARASYGIRGAHLPSLLRSLVACGWFGIQTWIGGLALNAFIGLLWPAWEHLGGDWQMMGYRLPHYLSFFLFWLMNMYFVWKGTESIKWLETLAAPFLLLIGIALLLWAAGRVGGISTILEQSNRLVQLEKRPPFLRYLLAVFIPWLTAMVGYWATLSLNIPDFTRYARSQKDQVVGQAIGLLTTMPLFAFIGVAVTSATVILYGKAIWNPITLLEQLTREYHSPLIGLMAMFFLAIATLSTNIAANVVAPANSFSNLLPARIDFKRGGLIAGLIGIFSMPWKLLDAYQGWLISYSGLLGAVGGVMICDYLLVKRTRLEVPALYRTSGVYWYWKGFHRPALVATAAGIGVALLGKAIPGMGFLFDGAWFTATLVSFALYYWLVNRVSEPAGSPYGTKP